jgi:hypothetical protein
MNHLHSTIHTGPRDLIRVTLDRSARVLVMDSLNYSAYQSGRSFRHYGGWAQASPCQVVPPHSGQWHVVIDLGGHSGTVRAGVSVLAN